MFSSETVPLMRNPSPERMDRKGFCWPAASVVGVSFTSLTVPATSL